MMDFMAGLAAVLLCVGVGVGVLWGSQDRQQITQRARIHGRKH